MAGKISTKKKKKAIFVLGTVCVIVMMAAAGIYLLIRYHKYSDYTVKSTIQMNNSDENTSFHSFGSGYIKIASDGITYFDKNGIYWTEDYTMSQPISDIHGNYIVVANVKQRDVYIYDKSGYVNRINFSYAITDVEVSKAGAVAVAANDGNANYIEIRDRNGGEILSAKTVFSSSGYLMDISLSSDGNKMAAAFMYIDSGSIRSKVVFYDFSDMDAESRIAGEFAQYESTVLTTVEFMDDNTVCAVGDNAISFYRFKDEPELIRETREQQSEIQTLFFSSEYVGMLVNGSGTDYNYEIMVYNKRGKLVLNKGTDFPYSSIGFAGHNVVLCSYSDCVIYSLHGVERFSFTFDEHIEMLISEDGVNFVFGTNGSTQFIMLK